MLFRQEELDDNFAAEVKQTHDEQLKAMEDNIRESALKEACPMSNEQAKKRDPKKLLTVMMMLGVMARQMNPDNESYVDQTGEW